MTHTKKIAHQRPPPKAAEVATKPKLAPSSKKLAEQPAKTGSAYAPAPSKLNDTSGQRVGTSKPFSIHAPSAESGLMRRAMDRLDLAMGAYEQQVKKLETRDRSVDFVEGTNVRGPLLAAAREVQGQLNSAHAHADGWFKDRPNEMKDAKGALQERNARFEALTQRANAADPSLHIKLPLQVPDRH